MHHIAELWRYYKIGVVNTLFGFGLYFALVWFGLNLFVAQIVAHVCGMVFNYFMFKVHVFHGSSPALGPYIGAYALNYLMGLGTLATVHLFVPSPYLAGLGSVVFTATINYFILKRFVFKSKPVQ